MIIVGLEKDGVFTTSFGKMVGCLINFSDFGKIAW